MKEKMANKIEELVNYIVSKPVEDVTLDDYAILKNELKDVKFEDSGATTAKECLTTFPRLWFYDPF